MRAYLNSTPFGGKVGVAYEKIYDCPSTAGVHVRKRGRKGSDEHLPTYASSIHQEWEKQELPLIGWQPNILLVIVTRSWLVVDSWAGSDDKKLGPPKLRFSGVTQSSQPAPVCFAYSDLEVPGLQIQFLHRQATIPYKASLRPG